MLYLDLGGLELRLKINQFRENNPGETEHDNWCYMDFAVIKNNVNIYQPCQNSPWLTCDEIKSIRDTISNLLDGSLTKNTTLTFIEQDINMDFVFNGGGKFSYADLNLYYWDNDGRSCLTANRLVLSLDIQELECFHCYLAYKTGAVYNKTIFNNCCSSGVIKKELDRISFKVIKGSVSPTLSESDYRGVVGIYINNDELIDIVYDIEKGHRERPQNYIHQTAAELLENLIPDDDLLDWQEENGAEILSCVCGIIEDGSPTVFIERDERCVYWYALGHNRIPKKYYYFPLKYVFDRKQYEQALEGLREFAKDKSVY